jgi:hypothetical protein
MISDRADSKQAHVHTDPLSSDYRAVRQISAGELQASQVRVRIRLDAVI